MGSLHVWYDYTGNICPNCGRVRVVMTEAGKRVCEKCRWIIEDEEYLVDDEEDYRGVEL